MLMDALKFLAERFGQNTQARDRVAIVPLPGNKGDFLVVDAQGNYKTHEGETPARTHQLNSLADVEALLKWSKDSAGFLNRQMVLWYNREGAVLIMDDTKHRRDEVILNLPTTDIWNVLRKLDDNQQAMNHRDLMRVLRRSLLPWMDPTVGARVVETLKVLEFENRSAASSTQTAARQGFGLEVDNQIRSRAGELPETLTVSVPIYRDRDLGQRYQVQLFLELDTQTKTFVLAPEADALDITWDKATEALGNYLRSRAGEGENALCPVFYGTP